MTGTGKDLKALRGGQALDVGPQLLAGCPGVLVTGHEEFGTPLPVKEWVVIVFRDQGYANHAAQSLIPGSVVKAHPRAEGVTYDDQLVWIDLRLDEEEVHGSFHIIHLALAAIEAPFAPTGTAKIKPQGRPPGDG